MSDEKISALLSDDRYDSKDWRQADLAGRIEWLIFMLKAKGEEVENMVRFGVSNSAIANETADRIEELEAAIKRQAGAARTLRQLTLAEVQHLSDMDRSEYFAAQTLNSERDANAILTDRIEELEDHLASMTGLWAKSDSEKQLLLARIEELEAKLAKAEVINGLLTVLAILNDPNDGRFPEAVDLAERFSTTLAELSSAMKGQDDE